MAEIFFNLPTNRKYFRFQKTLEGVTYSFTLQYHRRTDHWEFGIDGVSDGISLFGGVDLLGHLRAYEGVPPGTLFVYDYDELYTEANETTLGDRVTLKYIESE